MKKILALALTLFLTGTALASDMGVIIGIRNDSAESKSAGVDMASQNNFQAGLIAKFDVSDAVLIRSGFVYIQRNYLATVAASDVTLKYNYFEIPIGVLYKFNDFGGAFAGVALSLNQSKSSSVSGMEPTGVKSMIMPIQIGASFKFAPQMGAELYFETNGGDIDDNLQNNKAIVANLMITFE